MLPDLSKTISEKLVTIFKCFDHYFGHNYVVFLQLPLFLGALKEFTMEVEGILSALS